MKYLLDTHAFLWSIMKTDELPKKVITVLKNPGNEIYLSSISLWEIAIKTRLGKLELQGMKIKDLPKIIKEMDYGMIDMTSKDAFEYAELREASHKDPFNRMLISQCINRRMTIISKDSKFERFISDGLEIVW